jgi:hypothetical protein
VVATVRKVLEARVVAGLAPLRVQQVDHLMVEMADKDEAAVRVLAVAQSVAWQPVDMVVL